MEMEERVNVMALFLSLEVKDDFLEKGSLLGLSDLSSLKVWII